MFTLKVGRTGSDQGSCSWISGIAVVHRIGLATAGEYETKWATYLQTHGTRNFAGWLSPDEDVALLSCETSHGVGPDFYVICGTAWLLGPNGDTLERITP